MSEWVTLHIDGHEQSVPRGTTIIDAASQAGMDIPHLCYFEGLERTGSCRLCLVEVEGARELVVACTTRVREGMVVRTQTERVLQARRFVLELIWSTHPGDCTTCEKSGACLLQKYTYESGADKSRYVPTREYDSGLVDRSNPLIELDHNLCILCGRCVRMCQTQGNYVLDFVKRGMTMKVSTPFERPLHQVGCDFCGSCLSVCPVACLMERDRKFRGREWELDPVETVCPYCGCGCDLLLDTIGGQIVRARNSQRNGYLCARGRFAWDYAVSQERLERPLVKKDGAFTECTWDEALEYVSERWAQVKETHGPHALGGLISAHYPNEVLYLFQKFVRAGLGTNNVDSSVRLYSLPMTLGLLSALGGLDATSPLSAIEGADVLMLVGPDIATRYPLVGVKVKKALSRGAQVILIDPLRTKLAGSSRLHLRPKPGSEALLLRGIGCLMVQEGFYDEGFASRCSNFEAFKTSLSYCDEERTGVAVEEMLEAAKLYGDLSRRALIVLSAETNGLSSVMEVANLLLLTGRVKGGVVPCLPAVNLQGAIDLGAVAEFYPGYQAVSDPQAKKKWEDAWGASLSDREGLSALEMIRAAGSSVRSMYIVGENVVGSFPGTVGVSQALSALDFLVVQDIFLSETARLADVILPGISFAESEGTVTGAGHELRRLGRAIKPYTKPDWQTIWELSCRLGFTMRYDSEEEIRKEIETFLPAWPALSGQDLGSESPFTRSGGFSFHVKGPAEVGEETDEEYPFLLTEGSALFGYGDGSWTGRSRLSLLGPADGDVRLSPEDAASLGVGDGSPVRISSRRGGVVAATIRVDGSLPRGLVSIPAYSPIAQALMGSSLEPLAKTPHSRLWAIGIAAL